MAKRITIKATITDSGKTMPTLRLFLTEAQKQQFCLQKGLQPNTLFNVVIL